MSKKSKDIKLYEKPIFINIILFSVNLVLFILKLIFSFLTDSLALQADAFDNLTDLVMAFSALFGLSFMLKSPSEKFPYGYYKIENVISLLISFFIFWTAYNIIRDCLIEIFALFTGDLNVVKVTPEIIFFLVISLLTSVILTLYLKIIGKKSKSLVIESEGNEKLLDNLISSSVLIGFIGANFGLYFLDTIIGLFIAIFIIKGGYDIFILSIKPLLDAVIDFEKRNELYDLIDNFPKVKEVKSLEIRSYGKYISIEVNIVLNKDLPLARIDALKEKLTRKIKENFDDIFKVIILTSTKEKEIYKVAVPLESNNGLESKIYEHYGEAPFFAIIQFQEDEIIRFEVLPNKYKERDKRKGILISDWLVSQDIDIMYLKMELKKGPKLIFENSFIQVIQTNSEKLKEIVEKESSTS